MCDTVRFRTWFSQTFLLWTLYFCAIDFPRAMTSLRFIFPMFFFYFSLFLTTKVKQFIHPVNSSHEISIYYLYLHNVYVTEHLSVDPMYSLYGPVEIYMNPVGKLNIRKYFIRYIVAVDFTLHNDNKYCQPLSYFSTYALVVLFLCMFFAYMRDMFDYVYTRVCVQPR